MLVFACQYCAIQDAIVFCLLCGGRLCVLCDAALHAHAGLHHHHTRARLCDTCAAAPSALRYGDGATLCAGCAACTGRGASGAGIVTQYTGCPKPTELLRLISVEAPPSDNLFYPWLDDKLRYDDDDDEVELEQGWDVEVETAKIERMLADCNNKNNNEQQLSPIPSPPCQLRPQPLRNDIFPFSSSTSSSVAMPLPEDARPPQPDASSAIAKKREDRERAKLRYYEKKKNRRFCKQIMYASRKARADTRKRVKGRFAKSSSSSHDPQNDETTPIHEAGSIY